MPKPFNAGGKSLFNKCCWDNWIPTCKRMKLHYYLIPHIKINSKWIKGLIVRTKSIELLEENIGANLHDLGFDNGFSNMIPTHKQPKKK